MGKVLRKIVGKILFYTAYVLFLFFVLGSWNFFHGVSRVSFFLLSSTRTVHVTRVSVDKLTVDVYREKNIALDHEDTLRTTFVTAYHDLPEYLNAHYSYFSDSEEPMFKRVSSRVKVVILSEATYALFDRTIKVDKKIDDKEKKIQKQTVNEDVVTFGLYMPHIRTIYIRGFGNEFDARKHKKTMSHELFHHFYHVYGLGALINEWDAYEFGNMMQSER